jgi:uncharacterized protein (DUF362 family)
MAARPGMTRREILAGATGAAAAASLGGLASCFPSVGGSWPDAGPDAAEEICTCSPPDGGANLTRDQTDGGLTSGKPTVVSIQRDDSTLSSGKPDPDVVQKMVDQVLSSLAGGAANPWSVLLPEANACSRIGLKVNCLNANLPTSPAVVRAIIRNLKTNLHVCGDTIFVWDRNAKELSTQGKYAAQDLQGAHLMGTDGVLNGEAGPGYTGAEFGTIEGSTPRLSKMLTEKTDFTINCPVLKTHNQSGVTAGMKNIYGIIDIPGSYHDNLPVALPALYNLPQIRNSIKLTIVDAIQAVILGDTQEPSDSTPGRIFASLDPVATDQYALDLVNQLRTARNKSALSGGRLAWLDNARKLGLGSKEYELVEL